MYGCAFGVEIGAFRNAPSFRSAQLSSVRSGECEMIKNNKSERDWLTVTEACERADVSPNTIKKLGSRVRNWPQGRRPVSNYA